MTRIFVGNLPHTATESEVRSLFDRYGRVSSVQIKTDAETNRPRGFAFVTMPSMEDAEEAIARLSRSSMNGRALTVNEARARTGTGTGTAPHDDSARRKVMAIFESLQNQ